MLFTSSPDYLLTEHTYNANIMTKITKFPIIPGVFYLKNIFHLIAKTINTDGNDYTKFHKNLFDQLCLSSWHKKYTV